ncbi:MAG: hypothetical protein ACSLFO_11600 [Acidimicrobiales bacterium]
MMPPDANPDRAADEDRFAEISAALADAVEEAVPGWIERLVLERVAQWRDGSVPATVRDRASTAGRAAVDDVMPQLRGLLETDIDAQRTNPLAILRAATRHAHRVLVDLGMPPVTRDDFAERSFPDDDYDLVPATWSDVDPSLHEVGIMWGAAKAYVYKARRRDAGQT